MKTMLCLAVVGLGLTGWAAFWAGSCPAQRFPFNPPGGKKSPDKKKPTPATPVSNPNPGFRQFPGQGTRPNPVTGQPAVPTLPLQGQQGFPIPGQFQGGQGNITTLPSVSGYLGGTSFTGFNQFPLANPMFMNPFMNPGFTNPAFMNPAFMNPAFTNPFLTNSMFMNPMFTNPFQFSMVNQFNQPFAFWNQSFLNPGLYNPGWAQWNQFPAWGQWNMPVAFPQYGVPGLNPWNFPNAFMGGGGFAGFGGFGGSPPMIGVGQQGFAQPVVQPR